jgi:CRP/FNR family transcriptional regulator, dissimilatory nitrate respiration regulator
MDTEAKIAAVPLFADLTADLHRDLASIAMPLEHARGEIIFHEGEEAGGFYTVSQGRIKIYKLSAEGREQILHLFGPGEIFAEVALFAGRAYPAYAQALEASATLFFPRRALIDLIRSNPDLALSLLAVLSIRLRRFTHMIEDLSLKEVPGRLAAYLIFLSRRQKDSPELVLDITKTDLAGLLGTIPETLSRILGKMSAAGLLKIDRRRIRILDREGLSDLADAESRLSQMTDS